MPNTLRECSWCCGPFQPGYIKGPQAQCYCRPCLTLKQREYRLGNPSPTRAHRECGWCGKSFVPIKARDWCYDCLPSNGHPDRQWRKTFKSRVDENPDLPVSAAVPLNHPSRQITCVACSIVIPMTRHNRKKRDCCSPQCAGVLRRLPPRPPAQRTTSSVTYSECSTCEQVMVKRGSRKYCLRPTCLELRGQAERLKMSRRLMGLYRAAIATRQLKEAKHWHRTLCQYLADRDGARCHICNKQVNLTLSSGPRGHDKGPSIDHIIPVSQGGSDDLTNLRLAHWICNRQRGNRGGNEQLQLIA